MQLRYNVIQFKKFELRNNFKTYFNLTPPLRKEVIQSEIITALPNGEMSRIFGRLM
jgi:hypothetical protein